MERLDGVDVEHAGADPFGAQQVSGVERVLHEDARRQEGDVRTSCRRSGCPPDELVVVVVDLVRIHAVVRK